MGRFLSAWFKDEFYQTFQVYKKAQYSIFANDRMSWVSAVSEGVS